MATLQWFGQGRQASVNATGNTAISHIRVHSIGKVDRGCVAWQFKNSTLGSENVNFVWEQVNLDAFDELQGIASALLHFQQTLNPPASPDMAAVGGLVITFVQPVCGNALVGHVFHFPGSDLDLYGHPVHSHEHRMQGLVAVGLGNGDIVLELPWDGFVKTVNAAQYAVAGIDRIDDDTKSINIHNLRERFTLGLHFFVDTVEMLLPANHFDRMAFLCQGRLNLMADFVDQFLAVASGFAQRRSDTTGPHGIESAKAQVFKLHSHCIHSETHGDRCVDFQSFSGYSSTLFRFEHPKRAHVV